ncbi:MAG: glucose-6-phosphate isomerase [Lautropia sp.]
MTDPTPASRPSRAKGSRDAAYRPPTGAWRELGRHARRLEAVHLRDLLAAPGRVERMTIEAGGLLADFSKQRVDEPALEALFALADRAGLASARERLFAGAIVNPTERRPALHPALRGVGGSASIAGEVRRVRGEIRALAQRLRGGGVAGFRGDPIAHLVCIGIGGSDLGPRLVVDALAPADGFDVRFVANVDPGDLGRALVGLDPARTAFVVVSKTFTTRETLANADAARRWLHAGGADPAGAARHFIGVSANPQAAKAWGIRDDLLLAFWDWVGGRYSLWSAVGISIAAALGPEHFDALLAGAATMDRHFVDAPAARNLPVWLGLVSVWNRDANGLGSQAVIPYAERLRLLPAFLQQLVMESNGKTARIDGRRIDRPTAPVIWGVSGTNAQHSFFQQLHQGPDVVPVDFIVAREPDDTGVRIPGGDERHRILVANCLAQSAALALGRPLPDDDAGETWHKAFTGNRPSTTIVLERIDAASLGALLAAYEHATYVASVVLGINAFDQFGVEYGKVMAGSVESLLATGASDAGTGVADASTHALARRLAR